VISDAKECEALARTVPDNGGKLYCTVACALGGGSGDFGGLLATTGLS
jgi:hypothetical protein